MFKELILLLTLAAVQFTNVMDFMIMMPLGPQLMRLFDITPQQFGLIVSSYTFSAGLFGFIGAFFIDRFNRKNALVLIYFGFVVGTLACGVAPNYILLIAARVATGAFGGILGSLVLSIVGDAVAPERRGHGMGVVMMGFSVASSFGVPFGLYIASNSTWNAPFLFLAGIGMFILLLVFVVVPSMTGHLTRQKPDPISVVTNILKDGNQMRALSLIVLLMLGQFSVIPFLSPYMVSNVGFSEMDLPWIYFLGGFASFFTLPLIGKLSDIFGRFRVFSFFIFFSCIPIALVTNMARIDIKIALAVTTVFMISMGGRIIPSMAMITSTVLPQSRGGFMSINSSLQQIGSGMASYIAGMIVVKTASGSLQNYNYVGYFAIFFSLLCVPIAKTLIAVDSKKPEKESNTAFSSGGME